MIVAATTEMIRTDLRRDSDMIVLFQMKHQIATYRETISGHCILENELVLACTR